MRRRSTRPAAVVRPATGETSKDETTIAAETARRKSSNGRLERMVAGFDRVNLFLQEWSK